MIIELSDKADDKMSICYTVCHCLTREKYLVEPLFIFLNKESAIDKVIELALSGVTVPNQDEYQKMVDKVEQTQIELEDCIHQPEQVTNYKQWTFWGEETLSLIDLLRDKFTLLQERLTLMEQAMSDQLIITDMEQLSYDLPCHEDKVIFAARASYGSPDIYYVCQAELL